MNKKKFIVPEVSVMRFSSIDVICTSDNLKDDYTDGGADPWTKKRVGNVAPAKISWD